MSRIRCFDNAGPGNLAAFALAALAAQARAGGLTDYIRSYDLNDYALGVALSVSESPYSGASTSVYPYPYLTSFRHPAFTDDWLLVADGNVGARWVSDSGWVLGGLGRINTLGLGDADRSFVQGLDERGWTLEAGPLIGWRRWPVHLELRAYKELLGWRDGFPAQFEISLPREHEYGYVVPSFDLRYQSKDYNQHYFGVTPEESRPGRPVYTPGASLAWRLRLRYGHRVAEKWLLTTTVAWERLGDEVADSPLVDRHAMWSASLGLAYDADIFQPRDHPGDPLRARSLELRLGAFRDGVDTKIEKGPSDGGVGKQTDVKRVLGAPESSTLMQFDAFYRVGSHHRLHAGHFHLGRHSTATLDDDVNIGDLVLPAGTEVAVRTDFRTVQLTYSYSLIRDAQKELAFSIGAHGSVSTIALRAGSEGDEVTDVKSVLPVFGAHASVALGRTMELAARIQVFRLDADRYEGSLNFATLDLRKRFGERFSAGLGYNFYGVKLTSSKDDLRGTLLVRHQGPVVYFATEI